MARQALWAQAFLDTPYSVSFSERAIEPSQRSPHDNRQHSQERDIHAPGGIRTLNPSKRAATDSCCTARGHRGPHNKGLYIIIQSDSLARGPKLLSIKNYIIEIMT